MLNPGTITDWIVEVLQSIPELAAAMTVLDGAGNPVCRISGFHYRLGAEHRRAEAIYAMPAPSILVAWDGDNPGPFDGQTIYRHRFNVYFRMGNAAGLAEPVGYEDLWDIVCNGKPVTMIDGELVENPVNIRNMQFVPGLDIMDPPGIIHAVDEDQQDRFVSVFVFPEIGDQ